MKNTALPNPRIIWNMIL